MDKDVLKGLALIVGVFAVLTAIFFIVEDNSIDKGRCVAQSMRDGVPVGQIKKVCKLVD